MPKLCALLAVSQVGLCWVRAQQLCFLARIVALLFLCTPVAFPVFLCWVGDTVFNPFWSVHGLLRLGLAFFFSGSRHDKPFLKLSDRPCSVCCQDVLLVASQ